MPSSSSHKAEGVVTETRVYPNTAKVLITKSVKTPSLVGQDTTLFNLTKLEEKSFKTGDTVKVTGYSTTATWEGRVGEITDLWQDDRREMAVVKFHDGGDYSSGGFETKFLELVVPEPEVILADVHTPKDEGVGVSRYTAGMPEGVEARHVMSTQGWYEAFCKGSILKYITRLDHKGQYLSDLKKIRTYADELIKLEEAK